MIEIHALSGAYAVDALDDIERAQFERHLAECAECRAEVAGLRSTAALLAETTATAPPESLRERVLADIATVRPLPPAVATGAATRRRFRLAPLAAAAALVAAVGTGVVVTQPWADDTSQTQLSAVDQVLQADDAERYTKAIDGSEATMVRSRSLNKAVLVTKNMAPPPEGKVYELWLDHEGIGMVPAGLMAQGGEQMILLEGDPATATGAGITVEPAGGSEEPTLPPVTLFAFEQA
ncbi:anti-sigma factor [Nocardioides sp.]|uniref:anti-sigma factor n=1 Tax=Nocardioides sp. TaxID=35761 RepID=UPI002D800291|nr:anti-sigma factor [Nocardioides sp.]HET8959775.1 anti-sigma factor [Nocardioides sp.]